MNQYTIRFLDLNTTIPWVVEVKADNIRHAIARLKDWWWYPNIAIKQVDTNTKDMIVVEYIIPPRNNMRHAVMKLAGE
jgi:hypothetical protein